MYAYLNVCMHVMQEVQAYHIIKHIFMCRILNSRANNEKLVRYAHTIFIFILRR